MATIQKFEDIEAWKRARLFTREIYACTNAGAFARDFELRGQVRRAAVSILSNIAGGFERDGNKEFLQFLALAKASCGEARAQLYVALDQKYVSEDQFDRLAHMTDEISRMLAGFMNYLRQSEIRGGKFKSSAGAQATSKLGTRN